MTSPRGRPGERSAPRRAGPSSPPSSALPPSSASLPKVDCRAIPSFCSPFALSQPRPLPPRTLSRRCEERDKDDASSSSADDTTWGEVCTSCWIHPPAEWPRIGAYGLGILFFLYWFVFSLELLGAGAKALMGCAAAGLFGVDTNPVASLVVGMLATVLLQSSSTTTSITVSLIGAGTVPVGPAIYMVMGANIGT